MLPYVYSPVESEAAEVRLLTIEFDVRQVLGHQNPKPLAGHLENYHLPASRLGRGERFRRSTKLPFYFALSYVWGDGHRSQEIIIDGSRLPITSNLHAALRDLQASWSFGEIRVWVDAICINQEDQHERSAQIPLMREIYHMAAYVRVWLGPSSPEARRCAKFIAHLSGAATSPDDDPIDGEPSVVLETIYRGIAVPTGAMINGATAFGQSLLQLVDIIDPNYCDGNAHMLLDPDENLSLHKETIHELAKWRPSNRQLKKVKDYGDFGEIVDLISKVLIEGNHWFERMWVVQEVGVAQTVEFQIGNYALDWDNFVCSVHYLHYVRNLHIHSIRRVTGLQKIRLGFNDGKRQPLRDLIRETRSRGATDARDKIYALLGLMGDPLSELLKPDYSKSVNEVYANATLHFILQKASLDPICGQRVIGRRGGLPSWAPDYSLNEGEAVSNLVPIDGRESLYAASGYDHRSKHVSASRSGPWNELYTNGILLDTLKEDSRPESEDAKGYLNPESWTYTLKAASTNGRLQPLNESMTYWLSIISSFIGHYNLNGRFEPTEEFWGLFKDPPPPTKAKECPILVEIISTLLLGRISARERLLEEHLVAIFSCNLFTLARETLQFSKEAEGLKNLGTSRNAETSSRQISSTEPSEPRTVEKPDLFPQICQSIKENMTERRLIVTENGHLGVAPQDARDGDVVCVLFGCSVPVVLRKCERLSSNITRGDCEHKETMA